MTVFCPNCGKPNTDSATQCVACATALKPKAAGSKFKGTMMMTGLPKAGGSGPPPGPGGPPASGPPIPPPGAPPASSAPAPAAQKQNLAFQATMLGPISPPGAPGAPGGDFGHGSTEQPSTTGQPQGGFGAPPAQSGFGTPAQGGFGTPPPAQSGFGAPPAQSGFGAPPAQGGFGAPPAQGGFGAPPAQGGFGAPPVQGGFGAPPAQGGFGAPPAQGGFGTPPPAQGGFGASPSGFGSQPQPPAQGGFGAPPSGFGGAGAQGTAPMGAPMAAGGAPAKSNTGKYIAIGCGVLFMFCCVSGIIYQLVCSAMIPTMTPVGVTPPDTAAPVAGGGSVCARTAECCAAYLQAMNVPGTVDCNMYANMPAAAETGCQSAIEAWRAGLQAANMAVPSACQ